jgi:branched-chain amino acid aminotransferase
MSPALHYGQEAYEGMKAFRTPENKIQIFRPAKNALRLQHSASFVSIPPVSEKHFIHCVHAAVSLNAAYVPPHETGATLYIRPVIFGSSATLVLSPLEEYIFCVYVLPVGVYHGVHPVKALILEDFDRCAPVGTGSAEIGGNYAPVAPHIDKSEKEGYGITLHLDSKTRSEIDEFSTSAFIGVNRDSEKITLSVPESKHIIDSVTADSCLQIAKSKGWKTEVRSIKYDELSKFTEVIAAGTAAGLVPIRSISRKSDRFRVDYINETSDEPGEVCLELLRVLKGTQRGLIKDTFNWTLPVTECNIRDFGEAERMGSNGCVDNFP